MADSSAKMKTLSPSSYAGCTVPEEWEEVADSIAYDSTSLPPPIVLVCGPGNCGKSTFSRLLLNTLLQRHERVGYLDTDVGQPEFAIPGSLSLHVFDQQTPNFTILCLKTPERCFFFGDVVSNRDPKAYKDYIFNLYDYFLNQYYQHCEFDDPKSSMLPLVINTSGWVKGFGYDMLVEMLRHISPTHVVQIRIPEEGKNLPRGRFWVEGSEKDSVSVIEISAAQRDSTNRSAVIKKDARTIRDLRLIAYFRQCLPRELGISSYGELVCSLASIPPYELPLSRIKVMHLHSQVSSSEVYHSLHATIVGLAVSSSIPASTEDSTPWCVGFGIVRAVDISKDLLYMITPVPACRLEKVDIVLQGCLQIPTCLLQEAGLLPSITFQQNALHQLEPPEIDLQIAKTEKLLSGLLSD